MSSMSRRLRLSNPSLIFSNSMIATQGMFYSPLSANVVMNHG